MTDENSTACTQCVLLNNTHPSVAAFQGLLGLVSAISNIVALIALVKTENIKHILKICLIFLTVMDALSGIVFIYHSFALYFILHNNVECTIRYFLIPFFSTLSMMTVLTMTLERLFAVFLPLRYEQILTRRKLIIYLVSQSSFAIMLAALGLFYESDLFEFCSYLNINSSETYLIHGVPMMSTLLFTCIANLVIYGVARSHIKAMVRPTVNEENTVMENRLNLKATLTTLAVVVPFQISYLPLGIFFIYMYLHPADRSVLASYHFLNGLFSLTIINGIINPLVYSWRLPELRLSLKRLLKRH